MIAARTPRAVLCSVVALVATLLTAGTGQAQGPASPDAPAGLSKKAGAAPAPASTCRPVTFDRKHGKRKLVPGCRLAKIVRGKVLCMDVETAQVTTCRFDKRKAAWLENKKGPDYAIAGGEVQPPRTKRGSQRTHTWIVATARTRVKASANGNEAVVVPCASPKPTARAADDEGRPAAGGTDLAPVCYVENLGSRWNASGAPLVNYVADDVCSSNDPSVNPHVPGSDPSAWPHPEGAELARTATFGSGRRSVTAFCYTGAGAALNDINGMERDPSGVYYDGPHHCHMIVHNGTEVPAAKRPATVSYPAPAVDPRTPIVWRPFDPNVQIAEPGKPVPVEPYDPPAYD